VMSRHAEAIYYYYYYLKNCSCIQQRYNEWTLDGAAFKRGITVRTSKHGQTLVHLRCRLHPSIDPPGASSS
jgi:hypothetical protein